LKYPYNFFALSVESSLLLVLKVIILEATTPLLWATIRKKRRLDIYVDIQSSIW
jgi:hypothetical protein